MTRAGGNRHQRRRGIVLVNVLAILAIAGSVFMLMETLQETAIARSTRIGEAAEADAIARGGEAAALVALRQMGSQGSDSVDMTQGWTRLNESGVTIFGGSFAMRIADAQSRFNINMLTRPNILALSHLQQIANLAGLQTDLAQSIAARLLLLGPQQRLSDLAGLGIDRASLEKLSQFAVALPDDARTVNLNTVEAPLLAILLGNRGAALQLIARREREGKLTSADLQAARVLAPSDLGFSSSYFETVTEVSFGDTRERLSSVLRLRRANGGFVTEIIDRSRSMPAPNAPGS